MKSPQTIHLLILRLFHVLIYPTIVTGDQLETTQYYINYTEFEESESSELTTVSNTCYLDNIVSKTLTFEDITHVLTGQNTSSFLDTIKDPNVRNKVKTYLYYCPYKDICNFTLGLGHSFAANDSCCETCRCDDACRQDGGCCPDMIANLEEIVPMETKLKCQYSTLFRPPLDSVIADTGYFFIADCPIASDEAIRTGCTRIPDYHNTMLDNLDFSNMTPVTNIRDNLTYRNTFCASCHMIKDDDLIYWDVILRCKSFFTQFSVAMITEHIRSMDCKIDFKPPFNLDYKPEVCYPIISSCNETGKWLNYNEEIEKLCHSAYGSTFNNQFRNVFCMLCNNVTTLENPSCPPKRIPSDVSFTALLNFKKEEEKEPEEITQCRGGMIFDPFTQQCRKLYCSSTRILRDGQCVNFWTTADKTTWKITLAFLPLNTCPFVSSDQIVETIDNWFSDLLPEWMPFAYSVCNRAIALKVNYRFNRFLNTDTVNDNYTAYYELVDSNVLMFYLRWQLELRGPYELDLVYEMVQHIIKMNITLLLDNTIEMVLLPRLVNIDESWFDHPSDGMDLFFNYMQYNRANDNNTVVTYMNHNYQRCVPLSESLTLSDIIPCTLIELDIQQIDWYLTEYGVYITKLGLHCNMTNFITVVNSVLNESSLRVCTDQYMTLPNANIINSLMSEIFGVDVILSVVCTSISLVCLLITFLVYLSIPKLQTIPGKNNMLLMLNLFLAQVMYLVFVMSSNFTDWLCKAIGILLHFLWLSTIFWLNICTFHMLKTFIWLRKPEAHRKTSSKLILIYCITVITASVLFVAINIIGSLVISNMTQIGYGLGTCYISSGTMILYTFALPVGFVVISNLIMFLVVAYHIRSIPVVEKNVKHERNNFIVLIKLSSLTGITWIVGFLHEWTDVSFLSYVFIILNASLGLIIMVSFTFNRRVFNLIRSKFKSGNTYDVNTTL
ncbi:hypothetical protein ACJMK2_005927 [Sinanodonta woodiana]|uniref:G-protein coupled receptors family 2 profile 2 domain-containing protein n=1 Tax=Sinanodonta woodiana TaxID=1069815 RepID=A0ABD3VUN2_SINWO